MLDQIKTLLGIEDVLQDNVLNVIIQNVQSHLKFLLGKDVPEELTFIVVEIAVMRYNRLGSEGMKSELVEGHRTDFYEPKDDFRPYLSLIESVRESDDEPRRGRVMFI